MYLNHYKTVNLQNYSMCDLSSRLKRGNGSYYNIAIGKKIKLYFILPIIFTLCLMVA